MSEELTPTIEELAGQMFVAGFEGTDSLPGPLEHLLADQHLGGVILFARNIEDPPQARRLTDLVREVSPGLPPLVAVDQEGGRVQRFRKPFTRLPPAALLGAADDPGLAVKWGKVLGAELTQVGVNLDLAPVLDIATHPECTVIGDRALGSRPEDAERVARLGMAITLGMQQWGVGACGKHFPGHGQTNVDSHLDLPVIKLAKKRLKRVELYPFKRAAKGGMPALMPGHLLVPPLDPDRPASLSQILITDVLRDQLRYDGLVITDDLEMGAITERYDLETILAWGLEAEVDVFLFCRSLDKVQAARDLLVEWARSGRVEEERLRRSYERIARFKQEFPGPEEPLDPSVLGCAPHKRMVEMVREAAAQKGF